MRAATAPGRLVPAAAALALGLALALAKDGATGARTGGTPGDAPSLRPMAAVLRCEDARAQLAHARTMRGRLVGAPPEEREERRRRAVEAHLAVLDYWPLERWPEERPTHAEAAFRAGELLRAGGSPRAALDAFRRTAEADPGSVWHARALMEIGHLHRRAGRHADALALYSEAAAGRFPGWRGRDGALLWSARVERARGRADEARRLLRRVAGSAEDPVDRARAFARLARDREREGDLDAARAVLREARDALADVVLERTERGDRVRATLDRASRDVARVAGGR